jgi:hypothetical protein
VVSVTNHYGGILGFFRPETPFFLSSNTSVVLMRLNGLPFQNHYFSENLVALGIDPETFGSVARNTDH